jgi:integrase
VASAKRAGLPQGVEERHQKECQSRAGGRCNCTRSYRAAIYDRREKRERRSPWHPDKARAVKWRTEALRELDAEITSGIAPAGSSPLLSDAWSTWYAGAKSGAIANRNGERYKPRALESYERAWRLHVEPAFGHKRIGAITRRDVQGWIDKHAAAGMGRSTLSNALEPLRVLIGRAERRSEVVTNPTTNLELPATAEGDMRFADQSEAERFIEALPADEKALWATAFYGGLRRAELQAIRWSYVTLGEKPHMIVLKAWGEDGDERTKSPAGRRRVPIVGPLRALLKTHQKATGRSGDDLVFGRTAADPFVPSTVRDRALRAWKDLDPAVEAITLHQCRHTAASFMIAAGANAKALSVVMGHASIEITFNRYGHLMPGSEDAVGELLEEWLQVQKAARDSSASPIATPTAA